MNPRTALLSELFTGGVSNARARAPQPVPHPVPEWAAKLTQQQLQALADDLNQRFRRH